MRAGKTFFFNSAFPAWERCLLLMGVMVIYALLTLRVIVWINNHMEREFPPNTLVSAVSMEAHKPFVYRVLVPLLIQGTHRLVPDTGCEILHSWQQGLTATYRELIHKRRQAQPPQEPASTSCLITIGFAWSSLLAIGFTVALYSLGGQLFGRHTPEALLTPMLALLFVPINMFGYSKLYDTSTLFLTTFAFLLILKRKWDAYFVVFILACLNKETAIFLTLLFAVVCHDKLPGKQWLYLIGLQLVLYALITYGIRLAFENQPGQGQYDTLHRHLRVWFTARLEWTSMVALMAAVFLLGYRWPCKPEPLKRGLWVFLAMWVAWQLSGMPREYRVFYETFCILAPLLAHTLISGTGISQARLLRSLPAYQPDKEAIGLAKS